MKARLTSVCDLQMSFTGAPTDWPITSFHLEANASPARDPEIAARESLASEAEPAREPS